MCHNLPLFREIWETSIGRVAIITIPRFTSQIYDNPVDIVNLLTQALRISKVIGAHTVSLTGLIPSATDYGKNLTKVTTQQRLPQVTTGHATTAAAVVFTISKILEVGSRNLTKEQVGFLGLGSIGVATLRLMLKCLPHPKEIILCDIYDKRDFLKSFHQELVQELDFQGVVRLLESRVVVPSAFYEATLIVGATNMPDVLDIISVKPGTLIVDDSSPHCFNVEIAQQRLMADGDILFTEGGLLRVRASQSVLTKGL